MKSSDLGLNRPALTHSLFINYAKLCPATMLLAVALSTGEVRAAPVCAFGACIDATPSGGGGGGYGGGGSGGGDGGEVSSEDLALQYHERGWKYWEQGNLNAAAADFRMAIENNPTWHGYRNALGDVLFGMKDYAGALNAYRSSLALKQGQPRAHLNVGRLLRLSERYKEAEAEYITAIRLDPNYALVQSDLIDLIEQLKKDISYNGFQRAYKEKNPEKAEALYRQYLLVNPTDPHALHNLGRALQRQGYFIEAEAAYREAIRYYDASPKDRADTYILLNHMLGFGVNNNAFKELLAANEQGVAASRGQPIEAIKGRSMSCFDDSRGCVYSNDHALEKLVLAPRGGRISQSSLPEQLKGNREFEELQQDKEEKEKEYKQTYDALQAAWAIKDSGKGDRGMVDMMIVEQKNKLTLIKSEIRADEIKMDQKYMDLGFTPPEH